MVVVDAVGKIRETGKQRNHSSNTPVLAEMWNGMKEDLFGRAIDRKDEGETLIPTRTLKQQ